MSYPVALRVSVNLLEVLWGSVPVDRTETLILSVLWSRLVQIDNNEANGARNHLSESITDLLCNFH